jgi:hypothetical protein
VNQTTIARNRPGAGHAAIEVDDQVPPPQTMIALARSTAALSSASPSLPPYAPRRGRFGRRAGGPVIFSSPSRSSSPT